MCSKCKDETLDQWMARMDATGKGAPKQSTYDGCAVSDLVIDHTGHFVNPANHPDDPSVRKMMAQRSANRS